VKGCQNAPWLLLSQVLHPSRARFFYCLAAVVFVALRPPATVSHPPGESKLYRYPKQDPLHSWYSFGSGISVPPMNHAQDARATLKLHHYNTVRLLDALLASE
jgi:hypothetical protein